MQNPIRASLSKINEHKILLYYGQNKNHVAPQNVFTHTDVHCWLRRQVDHHCCFQKTTAKIKMEHEHLAVLSSNDIIMFLLKLMCPPTSVCVCVCVCVDVCVCGCVCVCVNACMQLIYIYIPTSTSITNVKSQFERYWKVSADYCSPSQTWLGINYLMITSCLEIISWFNTCIP